jgi:hypothetical protein
MSPQYSNRRLVLNQSTFGGGVFDLVDASPGTLVSDHFGLVEAVDGLGQRVAPVVSSA